MVLHRPSELAALTGEVRTGTTFTCVEISDVSPSRFWPLVEIHQEIRAHGFCAELAQQSDYLAPMVAGMVDYVDQLLPERIGIALASQVHVSQLFAQALWGECLDKLHLVTLYCLPSRF